MNALEIRFAKNGVVWQALKTLADGTIEAVDIQNTYFSISAVGDLFELAFIDAPHSVFQHAWALKLMETPSYTPGTNGSFNCWIGEMEYLLAAGKGGVHNPYDGEFLTNSARGLSAIGTADIADIGTDDNVRVLQYYSVLGGTLHFAMLDAFPGVLMMFSNIVGTTHEVRLRGVKPEIPIIWKIV